MFKKKYLLNIRIKNLTKYSLHLLLNKLIFVRWKIFHRFIFTACQTFISYIKPKNISKIEDGIIFGIFFKIVTSLLCFSQ